MLTMTFRMDDDAMGVFDTHQRAAHATCMEERRLMDTPLFISVRLRKKSGPFEVE